MEKTISKKQVNEDTILSLFRRIPSTMNQIAEIFGLHINEVSKYLGKLMRSDHIRAYPKDTAVYYQAVTNEDEHNVHV